MLAFTANEDLTFSSIDIIGKKSGNSLVEVYTRLGGYTDYEQNSRAWDLVFSGTVALSQNSATRVSLNVDVFTPLGSDRAFQIYAQNGILFKKGSAAAVRTEVTNEKLSLENGVSLKDRFKQVKESGVMSGSIG
jgi:hypothetical protein